MKEYARKFYKSQAWKGVRQLAMDRSHGLCERCLRAGYLVPGEAVHHKIEITAENIHDKTVTLNLDNLEVLCRKCHAEVHMNGLNVDRYTLDEFGRVIFLDDGTGDKAF